MMEEVYGRRRYMGKQKKPGEHEIVG